MAKPHKLSLPKDRAERLQYMKRMFPQAVGSSLSDQWPGGRQEALKRLNSIDLKAYKRNHEFINGAVSKLSPYLRYGCITLRETADNLIKRFGVDAEPFIYALAHRDYWRRIWYKEANGIFNNLEEPKVPIQDKPMPDYIRQMITGLPCMDGIIRDLVQEGYVHHHARKWFAAYVVHWLKIDWREAADWFENLLLDGDKASNHLSWQWVASTFSDDPYFFNKETLARYTGEKYCEHCSVSCPFDANREMLDAKLFSADIEPMLTRNVSKSAPLKFSMHNALGIYVHDEMLSAANPMLKSSMQKFFVFDEEMHGRWPLKRLQFVADCLSELSGVEVWLGNTHQILEDRGVGQLTTQKTPSLQMRNLLEPFKVEWKPEPVFINAEVSEKRLKRFSRYWTKVNEELFEEA